MMNAKNAKEGKEIPREASDLACALGVGLEVCVDVGVGVGTLYSLRMKSAACSARP
jgi:hypothetical protein